MLDAIVILKDQHYAKTLATLRFDKDGRSIPNLPTLITVDDWHSGFDQCWRQGMERVLFLRSGTVFSDFGSFMTAMLAHENQGLIGHLLYRPDWGYPMLHDQCFYADLGMLKQRDLEHTGMWPVADVSTQNVHDDYTPTWIAPAPGAAMAHGGFGSGLIAGILSKKGRAVNWNSHARSLKTYFYPDQPGTVNQWMLTQMPFTERITDHLWVTNNETLYPVHGDQFVGPAAGACWFLNLCRPDIQQATLVDISYRQLDFTRWLIDTWDGKDYGQFVLMYMFRNKVMSFTLDRDDVDAIDLIRQKTFASYVNEWLQTQLIRFDIDDLATAWTQARRKPIKLINEDLVPWVIRNHPVQGLWSSNVAMFKYTLLNNSWEDIEKFNELTKHG